MRGGRWGCDHSGENSRKKVQNVVTDSSAIHLSDIACGRARRYKECKDLFSGAKWKGGAPHGVTWTNPGDPVWWTAADNLDEISPDEERSTEAEIYNLDAAP
jgi:hypothetical protein